MYGFESFDICDNLTPHVPFLVGIAGVIFDKGAPWTVARRHGIDG